MTSVKTGEVEPKETSMGKNTGRELTPTGSPRTVSGNPIDENFKRGFEEWKGWTGGWGGGEIHKRRGVYHG